ncbi:MAG: SdrD B-like domain-containing protein, partial [Pseudomonadota bacterium]
RDDVDNDEPGLNGLTVTLTNLVTQETFTTQTATIDGVDGSYFFGDLEAGRYEVTFAADPDGKAFVAPNDPDGNGDDTTDSDAILNSDGTASSEPIDLGVGENVTDIDAGVENLDPDAADDMGEVCYDEVLNIDVLANDTDANGDALAVTAINGQAFDANGQVTLANGVVVTLEADGTLSVDGENATVGGEAVADLLFGETATDSFVYTTSDGNGGEATANVDVTFKGATDTLEKFDISLEPLQVSGQLFDDVTFGDDIFAFDFTSIEPSDSEFAMILDGLDGGGPIDLTFCLSIATFIDPAPVIHDFTIGVLDEASYLAAMEGALDDGDFPTGGADDGGFNGENIDNVNWILNEAENLIAEGFSQGNIQRAIWNLVDGGDDNVLDGTAATFFFNQNPEFGDAAPALEISNRALSQGEGFVAGEGDKVGLVLDPVQDGVQPLVIAVDYDELVLDCIC